MTDNRKNTSLDPSANEIRRMGAATVDLVARYLETIGDKPLMPVTSSREVRAAFNQSLPVEGSSFESLLSVFENSIIPNNRHTGHPRFFGYVASPGTAATALADYLASTLNPTVTSWRSTPAATEIELLTIGWIKEIIGYPQTGGGLFVSGGSMANFCALAVARESAGAASVVKAGLQSSQRPLRLYIATEGHHSSAKAAALLGIGYDNVQHVAIDEMRQMDMVDLKKKIEADIDSGYQPFCVVASAGTTICGAVDPIDAIADVAAHYGIWLHVDACYGGFAALSPAIRSRFAGIERADSVALDPHKWLYVPGDCGCILYRDTAAARATFGSDADYIRVIGQEPAESFAFWDYGPELTRRFRALKVWMMLAHVGTKELARAVEENCDRAEYVGELIDNSSDFELLTPVGLSVFCFRYVPPSHSATSGEQGPGETAVTTELNLLNEKILAELQRQGSSYLSNAELDGRFALRGCVLNFRTTRADMETLLDDVRAAAQVIS